MAKKVRFPLDMGNEVYVRTLEELKENYNSEKVTEYFLEGRLLIWLNDRYYEEEAAAVGELAESGGKENLAAKLGKIFGVEIQDDVDVENLEIRREKLEKLRQITADDEILNNVDSVAFSQEELGNLLDDGADVIYLCGDKFHIPLSVKNVRYVGINNPVISIGGKGKIDFKESGISFEKCELSTEINGETILKNTETEYDEYADIAYTDEKYFRLENKDNIVRLKKYVGKDAIVKIPNNVNEIFKEAFQENKFIEKVILPKSVEKIGRAAFHLCENLEYVNIPYGVKKLDFPFYGCNLKSINIPDSVIIIGGQTFEGLKWIKDIIIPDSVKEIGRYAFAESGIENIQLPKDLKTIEDGLFNDCEYLKEINLPNGIIKIGDCAFAGCKRLKTINIPDTVTEIGDLAFFECDSLIHIYLPDSVTKITEKTFSMFSNLKVTYRGETFSNQQLSFILKSEVEKPGSTKGMLFRDTFPKFKVVE